MDRGKIAAFRPGLSATPEVSARCLRIGRPAGSRGYLTLFRRQQRVDELVGAERPQVVQPFADADELAAVSGAAGRSPRRCRPSRCRRAWSGSARSVRRRRRTPAPAPARSARYSRPARASSRRARRRAPCASTRLILRSSSIRLPCVGSRPAVSASTTSMPRPLAALTASNITAAGSPPACWITATPLRSPHADSCSRAAARNVSPAASSTDSLRCLQPLGELADRRRLAGAVDARQHDDERALAADDELRLRAAGRDRQTRHAAAPADRHRRRRGGSGRAGLSSRCRVASTPTSAVSSAVSSSSSASSSSTRRRKAPVSAPDSFSRDSPSPAFSRSAHEASRTTRPATRLDDASRRVEHRRGIARLRRTDIADAPGAGALPSRRGVDGPATAGRPAAWRGLAFEEVEH